MRVQPIAKFGDLGATLGRRSSTSSPSLAPRSPRSAGREMVFRSVESLRHRVRGDPEHSAMSATERRSQVARNSTSASRSPKRVTAWITSRCLSPSINTRRRRPQNDPRPIAVGVFETSSTRGAAPLVTDHPVRHAVQPHQCLVPDGHIGEATPRRQKRLGNRIIDELTRQPSTAVVTDRTEEAAIQLVELGIPAGVSA